MRSWPSPWLLFFGARSPVDTADTEKAQLPCHIRGRLPTLRGQWTAAE
jgi:hypothetical protein